MKAEKLIKEKLNELNEIPDGFHFDQADTWRKLQERLDAEASSQERYSNLWLSRLKNAISGLSAANENQHTNRRRARKGLNGKKGFDQK